MIIEEQKVEVIEQDNTKNTSTSDFKPIKEKKSSKHWALVTCIFIIIFLCLIITIFLAFTFFNYQNIQKIAKGIYISGIDVSSLTKSEAKEKLSNYYTEKLSNDITLTYNNYTTYIKTSEIDLSFDIDSAINYAYQLGKTNNIFEDNFQIFNAMINGINILPTAQFNEESLKSILNTISLELPDAVVESGYYIEENTLIITKGQTGSAVNINSTTEKIKQKIANLSYFNEVIEIDTILQSPKELDLDTIYNEIYTQAKDAYYTTNPYVVYPSENGLDFSIPMEEAKLLLANAETECEIPLKVLYPNVTTNMIGQEAFPDLLATYSTKYASSNTNRTTNLRLAAGKIDGTVLLPGDVFSYNAVVGERTIAAGYKEAAIYQNGQVVDGLGGGICQISTTLYNAVLFANLEIVELYNHQFVPSYVTAGRDATVVYGVKDFKFKNSRQYAIKITCSVSNGIAKFQIWGVKEETEYDVEVYANITSRTSSYIKAATYRTLKLNGQIISTEKIANSTYRAH